MGQKNGNPFLITLGKDKTEEAGGHKDPAGAQGDDSQHNQAFATQEIVPGVNRRKQQEGREGRREETQSLPGTQQSHAQFNGRLNTRRIKPL